MIEERSITHAAQLIVNQEGFGAERASATAVLGDSEDRTATRFRL